MRIDGKPLGEIFADMPWPFKAVVIVGIAFIIYTVYYTTVTYQKFKNATGPKEIYQLKARDKPAYDEGLFDPSMASDGKTVAVSYTTLAQLPDGIERAPSIRLMSAPAPCKTWSMVREANDSSNVAGFISQSDKVIGPDSLTPLGQGTWRIETSSIVYDPLDKGSEWKLYAYKYVWLDKSAGLSPTEIARIYGFIVYKHAPSINGPWSPEEWLFSARPDAPPPPYTSMVQTRLNTLDPSLKDVYFYSRPSVAYADGLLFMTLSAFIRSRPTVDRVVLLASLDHGKSWRYLGTPLRHDDVTKMGEHTSLGGAGLFNQNGKIYFWAVAGSETLAGQGTMVMQFDNITKGRLKAGDDGLPEIMKTIKLQTPAPGKVGGGYAAYSGDCKDGIITSEFSSIGNSFKLVPTNEKPLDD